MSIRDRLSGNEAIATILEVAPLKETGRLKKLLVAGCLSQRYQDEVLTELPALMNTVSSLQSQVESITNWFNGLGSVFGR